MCEDDIEWYVPVALVIVLYAMLTTCSEAQEQPITVRDLTLNEARAAALASTYDSVECYQERRGEKTHICITEAEWKRQHAGDVTFNPTNFPGR